MTTSVSTSSTSQGMISRTGSWANGQRTVSQSRTWFLMLIVLATMSNVIYTCNVPLVGFAAISGITLTRRKAMLIIFTMWVVNQVLGFTMRQYPWTLSTFAWGGVMLLGAMLATVLASYLSHNKVKGLPSYLSQAGVSLVGGYVVYELIIWLAGFVLGGVSGFTLPILWQILISNGIWAMVLTGIYSLLIWRVMQFTR
ncbi:MAG: hypothetical protein HC916_16825 [Coleofasciculaceae cyanobacterium SM2_1_6]|nr:hypothetical protein [Coleofasciculaceae cyanobacterium SM2_1_6]